MIYREFRPSPALAPFVERLWCLEGPAHEIRPEPIPPDGRAEIIVHGGDPFLERDAGEAWRPQARVLLAGQLTRAVSLLPRGDARLAGARLQPHALRLLLGVPAHEVTDRIVDLTDVQPGLARALRADAATREQAPAIALALDRRLSRVADRQTCQTPAAAAVSTALARRGLTRVDHLASRLGISTRQLERLFQRDVGVPPKLFLRIVRFQQVLRALDGRSRDRSGAALAAYCGFYDQAHFTRDFKAFVGTSPGAWSVDADSLTALFSAVRRRADLEAGAWRPGP